MTHDEWVKLSPLEQRIKVAELCGWKDIRIGCDWGSVKGVVGTVPSGYNSRLVSLHNGNPYNNLTPDYLNDLNAMHEVEKTLTRLDQVEYRQHLFDMCRKGHEEEAIHATAAQRAEAFVLTMTVKD